jgi:hypothetical protein
LSFLEERDSRITKRMNSGVTFGFAIAIANASTHTNYLITLLKSVSKQGSGPFSSGLAEFVAVPKNRDCPDSDRTHNYTGDSGPRDSPHPCETLDFWGLTEAHRYLSERGIITAMRPRSTNNFRYLEARGDSVHDPPHGPRSRPRSA